MAQVEDRKKSLEYMVGTIGELPSAPAIVSVAMGLTSNLDSKITDITALLSADQSLSARSMKLSNSAHYGRKRGVQTLEEAIWVLGFQTVRSNYHGRFDSQDVCYRR